MTKPSVQSEFVLKYVPAASIFQVCETNEEFNQTAHGTITPLFHHVGTICDDRSK